MYAGRRIAALRVTALAALAVSAILYADSLHPGRGFCPMGAACDKARSSALGKIFGVPTSIIGMAAFGGLYFLSMLRVEISRKLLRPAGFMAALVGAGLFGYQAIVIHSFCPLCLVADTAGLVAGLIVLTWPKTPVRRSGKKLAPESMVAKLRWMTTAFAIVAAPFLWPRPQKPSWVTIPDAADAEVATAESIDEADAIPGNRSIAPAKPERGAYVPDLETADTTHESDVPPPMPDHAPGGLALHPSAVPPALPSRPPPPPTIRTTPRPTTPITQPPPPPPPRADVSIVEYVNAFCSHCRVTHERLERVLAQDGVVARRRRVYSWSQLETPMWAKAVAFAQGFGLEDRMFEELVRAEEENPREVYAAARRAGVDIDALEVALKDGRAWPRLDGDRRAASNARLEGLPTFDIGRRRLMGEQSEAELREALRAALPRAEPSR